MMFSDVPTFNLRKLLGSKALNKENFTNLINEPEGVNSLFSFKD